MGCYWILRGNFLYRSNPMETHPSFPYTDLRLRLKRNVVFLLKKLFLAKLAEQHCGKFKF